MNDEDLSRLEAWEAEFGKVGPFLEKEGLDPSAFVNGLDIVRRTCHQAWLCGFMTGFNGNMSLRLGNNLMLVTATGVAKGHMDDSDIALATAMEGKRLAGGALSSETAMHTAVYRARPEMRYVLHTHPGSLLALSVRLEGHLEKMFDMPLFEARMWKKRLAFAGAFPPGSQELADSVGEAVKKAQAVFMEGHGLCVAAQTMAELLGFSEQIEHVAEVQLKIL